MNLITDGAANCDGTGSARLPDHRSSSLEEIWRLSMKVDLKQLSSISLGFLLTVAKIEECPGLTQTK